MSDLTHELPTTPEDERGIVLLTPSQAEHIIMTGAELDSVDTAKATLAEEEIAEGVADVECAGISVYPLFSRPELKRLLSDDFKGAVLRLQRRPSGDTTRLTVTTYHGDPKQEGKHSSEYNCEVYVFDSEGRVIEGHYEVSKIYRTFEDHPQGNSASEVIVGDPIPEDELAAKAAARVKDINVCVDAGI